MYKNWVLKINENKKKWKGNYYRIKKLKEKKIVKLEKNKNKIGKELKVLDKQKHVDI